MNTGRLVTVYRRAALVLIIGLLALRGVPSIHASEGNLPPSLVLADLKDQIHSLAQYRGQVVLINFWATWCPPCLAEMPTLEAAWQRYRVVGLVVLAVTGDHEDTVQEFRLRRGTKLSFPILIDRQAKAVRDWNIKGLPTTFIVGRTGKVRWQTMGAQDFSEVAMQEIFEALLAERP